MPTTAQYVNQLNPKDEADFRNLDEAAADMFMYHPWNEAQIAAGAKVREALENAFKTVVANVPPSPDRTVALRKIREARMDANSAITHQGRY